jgi:hypothetical protein
VWHQRSTGYRHNPGRVKPRRYYAASCIQPTIYMTRVINLINEMQDVNYQETCTLPSTNKLYHGNETHINTRSSTCFMLHQYCQEQEESMSRDGQRYG